MTVPTIREIRLGVFKVCFPDGSSSQWFCREAAQEAVDRYVRSRERAQEALDDYHRQRERLVHYAPYRIR